MASSITQSNVSFPVGTQVFTINTFPAGSTGFEVAMTRDSTWDATGHLFDFTTESTEDGGVTWQPISRNNMDGGPGGVRNGVPVTRAIWTISFGAFGSAEFTKRSAVRVTLNVARAFTSPLVVVRSI